MIEHDIKQDDKQASATFKQDTRTDEEIMKEAMAFMAGVDDEPDDYEPVDNYRYSLKYAYELFCQGEGIWWCQGNFINDFWVYFPQERQALIDEEIEVPAEATPEQRKWAVFFAASGEYLAHRYGLSVPSWTQKEAYKGLSEKWYFHEAALRLDDIREEDERETAEEYSARNIICGGRIWYNKKERIPGTEPQTERIA